MLDEKAMTTARFNYYPHCPKPDHVYGMKPHSDKSVMTIVFNSLSMTKLVGSRCRIMGFGTMCQLFPMHCL
jgi:hypothetical protein